jgi:hypothetical protein
MLLSLDDFQKEPRKACRDVTKLLVAAFVNKKDHYKNPTTNFMDGRHLDIVVGS